MQEKVVASPINVFLRIYCKNTFIAIMKFNWPDQCHLKFRKVLYKRFEDDIFLVFTHKSNIAPFLDYLNKQYPAMRLVKD